MNYTELSKEELLQHIYELELLNKQLLKEKEQDTRLEYAWTGNLGHWYWNVQTNKVTFNHLKVTTLGYTETEIPEKVTYQFFTDKLHPDDYQKTMDAMRNHLYGNIGVYEVEYRIRTKDGKYKWYYDRGKITQYDHEGKPVFLAGVVFDVTEKKELQLELEHKNRILAEQSSVDGLTGLKNHRTLIEQLKFEISEANRTRQPLCIGMFDIDNFKKVNDSKGHIYGDKVLADIASIIQGSIRNTDMGGRYGGEEFVVILPNTQIDVAFTVAERIRKAIEEHIFDSGQRITISGGVEKYQGQQISEFIHAADVKLYEAKGRGKNQIIF